MVAHASLQCDRDNLPIGSGENSGRKLGRVHPGDTPLAYRLLIAPAVERAIITTAVEHAIAATLFSRLLIDVDA